MNDLGDNGHENTRKTSREAFRVSVRDLVAAARSRGSLGGGYVSRQRAVASWGEHAAILRAILDRDEELAALLASRHVTSVGRDLLGQRSTDRPKTGDGAPAPAPAPPSADMAELESALTLDQLRRLTG